MTTIRDAFELPSPEGINAMDFVVRLAEADPDSAAVQRLVNDYVITPTIAFELPAILDKMKQVFDRGEEYGRFIHGSFGSGKSHFMTILALLVEGAAPAWQKFRPLFQQHRSELQAKGREALDHEAWLAGAGLLVVRIHMLTVRGKDTGFDRAIYEGFNAALKRRGKAPFEFLHLDRILDEIRREAADYGDIVWARLEATGIVEGSKGFEKIVAGSLQGRERLVRAWLAYKERAAGDAGIDPNWSEGLRRMTDHAKAQGFKGIVLMIDEFLLWLAEKDKQSFIQAINNLNLVVDHTTGQRSTPVFIFVARQRNLKEFFPDLVDENEIHEHLDHHSKRFEETRLLDIELRHIVKGRVLHPKRPEEVQAVVDALAQQQEKVLPGLLAGADISYLRDVYPFHPALIEMLVDVTSLMQRERTALRLLYELLVVHYPDLPLGQFLPVGSAFAALFPSSGVDASKKVDLMLDIHRQYYQRLAAAMQHMSDGPDATITPERLRALDQIIKTVLLAEVSPRLKGGGLTIERLVQLNSVDVDGETFRSQVRLAETDLLALSRMIPDLQIVGSGKAAQVTYVLGRVSLTEVLGRARTKSDNQATRFKVFWAALKASLGLANSKGFEEAGPNEGDWELIWRKTRRRGQLRLCNLRDTPQDAFAPSDGSAFKVLVDYPWDEPGIGVEAARTAAGRVRRNKGLLDTVCWLPRYLTASELDVLTDLAAVRFLLSSSGQADLLTNFSPQDKTQILELAGVRQNNLEEQLDALLKEIYIGHGEFLALVTDVADTRPHPTLLENLVHITTRLMDRRFPQHPDFLVEPKKADLEALLGWMVSAGETGVSLAYDDTTGRVLRQLGEPLELVNLGQTKATLRLDTRYIKDVMQRVEGETVVWGPVADHLRSTYGFTQPVVDLFLCFLCQRDHRALKDPEGDPIEPVIGMSPSLSIRLQRGKVVGSAEWSRLRELGPQLFDLARPAPHRSLQLQDRYLQELRGKAVPMRTLLQGLHTRLAGLVVGPCARLQELATATARLAPLAKPNTDSHQALLDLLGQWPEDPLDPIRVAVLQAQAVQDALGQLNESVQEGLLAGKNHHEVGPDIQAHLGALDGHLRGAQNVLPLTKAWVEDWTRKAMKLTHRLITQASALPPEPPPPPESKTPKPGGQAARVLVKSRIDPGDADEISTFLDQVRNALADLEGGAISLVLTREEEL
jgi:hypothetical protein